MNNYLLNQQEIIQSLKEKTEILEHQCNLLNFLQSLNNLNEHTLRTPLRNGKWSVIEIIGHFYPWDEFVLQLRLPYLLTSSSLPPSPNADKLNYHSSQLAKKLTNLL